MRSLEPGTLVAVGDAGTILRTTDIQGASVTKISFDQPLGTFFGTSWAKMMTGIAFTGCVPLQPLAISWTACSARRSDCPCSTWKGLPRRAEDQAPGPASTCGASRRRWIHCPAPRFACPRRLARRNTWRCPPRDVQAGNAVVQQRRRLRILCSTRRAAGRAGDLLGGRNGLRVQAVPVIGRTLRQHLVRLRLRALLARRPHSRWLALPLAEAQGR